MQDHMCPACGATCARVAETVPANKLASSYRSKGIDATPYLNGHADVSLLQCDNCQLGFFIPACAGDAGFYEQLQTQDWYYQDDKPEYGFAKDLVPPGSAVLEIGCGKGAFHCYLPDSVRYTGLEFNDAAVRKAQAAGLDVIRQPIEEHVATGRRYDVVCSFQVLEHVTEPGRFFHDCVQALRPGGRVIIAVPAQDSFLAIAANSPLNMPPHHLTRWSDAALVHLARSEQLERVELWHEPVAPFHRDWHESTLAMRALARAGLIRYQLIDDSLRYRVLSRLIGVGAVRSWLLQHERRAEPWLDVGHTVVMAAQRPAARSGAMA